MPFRPARDSRLLYASCIDGCGVKLFEAVCRQDLEGIVAKQKHAPSFLVANTTRRRPRSRTLVQTESRRRRLGAALRLAGYGFN